ncbi:hypothetical protein [Roseimarinus sediminis]|uniref:hypothetical protein n=1 Tax=Roseimarinus sediminis TaxID=1610899 RepID=UPI003D244A21
MSKRTIYIIGSIVVLVLAVLWWGFLKPRESIGNTNVFKAIPQSSPLVFKINKPVDFIEHFNTNKMIQTLHDSTREASIFAMLHKINALAKDQPVFYKVLKGNEVIVSLNHSGREQINALVLRAVKNNDDSDQYQKLLNSIKNDHQSQLLANKYNKVALYEITTAGFTFYTALHKGIIMLSDRSLLIEESIRQLNADHSAYSDALQPLLKTIGQQADINTFINHQHTKQLATRFFSKSIASKTDLLSRYAALSEIDIQLDDEKIMMSGFTLGDNENDYFSEILQHQQAVQSRIDEVLPASSAFFISISLSDISSFFNKYEDYLKKHNLYFQRQDQLLNIQKETGTVIQELFASFIDEETAMAAINVDQSAPTNGRIWAVKTKSGSTAFTQVLEFQQSYLKSKGKGSQNWEQSYSIDNQTSFSIHRFPYPGLPELLFGKLYAGIKAEWFTVYDNYLIFGDSFRTVAKAVHSNVLGETLSSNIDFNKFKSNLNGRSNVQFFSNTSISLPIAGLLFNSELAGQLTANDHLRKFRFFAWQLMSANNMVYNNSCITFSEEIKAKPQTIWQSHLEASFDFKPRFVLNHYDRLNKEIVIQDHENNFYLINNVGRILWKLRLDAPIMGEVHQIDYFNNGKLQYLFNTENKLYLIDRNGNNVKNFPLNFRAKASNGVSIFDYDNNKDYRFFVACTDRKIYAYDINGKLLEGWNLFTTDHEVKHPVQHFRVDGKDYLVASDRMKDYVLHRVGTVRVQTNEVYAHSGNTIYLEERTNTHEPRMVTTDTEGRIHYTYFDGTHKVLETGIGNQKHYFTLSDIDSDNVSEYIFVSDKQLKIIEASGSTLLNKTFENTLSHQPNIYTFSRNQKKIGLTSKSANKIYLIDAKGNNHPGFPLEGCTEFSIGFISEELSNFNLLVGSPDGYLYNYYVE